MALIVQIKSAMKGTSLIVVRACNHRLTFTIVSAVIHSSLPTNHRRAHVYRPSMNATANAQFAANSKTSGRSLTQNTGLTSAG